MANATDIKQKPVPPPQPLCGISGCKREISFNRKKFPERCMIWKYCNVHRQEYSLRKCTGCHEVVNNDRDIGPAPYCSNACLKLHTDESKGGINCYKPAPFSNMYCCWCLKGFDIVTYTVTVGGGTHAICSEICGKQQADATEELRVARLKQALNEGPRIFNSNQIRMASMPTLGLATYMTQAVYAGM